MTKEILLSRSEFARRAGVVPSSVTRACAGVLKDATVGNRIDAAHPAAVKYLDKNDPSRTPPAATGLDIRYEEAVAYCVENNRYSITGIQRGLSIGYNRAKAIFVVMKAGGLIPEKDAPPTTIIEPITAPRPHVRGHSAKNETKKNDTSAPPVYEIPEDIQELADMPLRELVDKFGTDVRFLDWLKAVKSIEDINDKRIKNAKASGELVSRYLVKIGIIDPIDSAHIKLLTDGAKTITRRSIAMRDAGASEIEIEKFVKDQISSFIKPVKSKVARALKNV
jgi:hypothetical protein